MSHLSPETFVDLLDGSLTEASVPHLAGCRACRQQLAELRATWQAADSVETPEPSPLFWDHLSARVREAVSTEALPARGWWPGGQWRMAAIVGAAAAVLAVAVTLGPLRSGGVNRATTPPESTVAVTEPAVHVAEPLPEDESLGFVVDLASNINWDSAADFGLTAHGDADRALADMDDADRAELRRLLDEALGNRKI
jgi:hypothetical protein